jgi:enamine deaminase RidA (YjgF/YER057c/UK114 family)
MAQVSLQLEYVSARELAARPASWWGTVLGLVGYDRLPPVDSARVPTAAAMTPVFESSADRCEAWRVSGAVGPELERSSLRRGRIHYRHCGEFLFGSIAVDEPGGSGAAGALLQATTAAYQDIFALIEDTGHPHLIRIWNYLPEINRDSDGDERYRIFNTARQAAFRNSGRSVVGSVPAACALGSPAGSPVCIYFLASRAAPRMIENPRQMSAYHYPPKFGIHSPTFSRACVLDQADGTSLFVSGTASIVGCETTHGGDAAAQTREILANIEAVLEETNRVVGSQRYALDSLRFKVYVRRPADLEAVRSVLDPLRGAAPIVYLQADICREDLLVEIEASGTAARDLAQQARFK